MKLDPYLTLHTIINSKWIKDINIRPEVIKLLEENVEQKLYDTGFGTYCLTVISKAQSTKEKLDKLDFMKMFKLHVSKKPSNKVKRQSTDWVKIFASYMW